ncbi:hypothetical protein DEO72_LG3g1866 [Vigna unguiculata]|uniref:Uncharacterized protein n=1 Tax=Vigna unguiculata TaxID=3917 RepID=A0A4D6LFD0_VIGUN|nr:hypothetical protein DEO72_LG3g1866 [Vigna unguiculata]
MAPSDVRCPLGSLEAFFAWQLVWNAIQFLIKQTLCFACFGCAWSTRLWVISQGSDAGAFFELWLRIASVPACVLQVVACRLDSNDSLRLSTKDIKHGSHGGGHV